MAMAVSLWQEAEQTNGKLFEIILVIKRQESLASQRIGKVNNAYFIIVEPQADSIIAKIFCFVDFEEHNRLI